GGRDVHAGRDNPLVFPAREHPDAPGSLELRLQHGGATPLASLEDAGGGKRELRRASDPLGSGLPKPVSTRTTARAPRDWNSGSAELSDGFAEAADLAVYI